jgi:hypothetical protein
MRYSAIVNKEISALSSEIVSGLSVMLQEALDMVPLISPIIFEYNGSIKFVYCDPSQNKRNKIIKHASPW